MSSYESDLQKYVFLDQLHNRNDVVYYRLLADHMSELLPVVYDPTVGEAIKKWSRDYRRTRAVYLSIDRIEDIELSFDELDLGPDDVDLLVCSDAEQILGIGDWGVNGTDISVGKLAIYTAAAGIHPGRTIAVNLDCGTNNEALLNDPAYLGNRHSRVRGKQYDDFIATYLEVTAKKFPKALLRFEDFGASNARRILVDNANKYRIFNDDMQGTGAIVMAAIISGMKVTHQTFADQRLVVYGAGTAGTGMADQIHSGMVRAGLSEEEAKSRVWLIDINGLVTDDMKALPGYQQVYARHPAEVKDWNRAEGKVDLLEVVKQVKPTILIGTSTDHGAFTQQVIEAMADGVERPIILPPGPCRACPGVARDAAQLAALCAGASASAVAGSVVMTFLASGFGAGVAILIPGGGDEGGDRLRDLGLVFGQQVPVALEPRVDLLWEACEHGLGVADLRQSVVRSLKDEDGAAHLLDGVVVETACHVRVGDGGVQQCSLATLSEREHGVDRAGRHAHHQREERAQQIHRQIMTEERGRPRVGRVPVRRRGVGHRSGEEDEPLGALRVVKRETDGRGPSRGGSQDVGLVDPEAVQQLNECVRLVGGCSVAVDRAAEVPEAGRGDDPVAAVVGVHHVEALVVPAEQALEGEDRLTWSLVDVGHVAVAQPDRSCVVACQAGLPAGCGATEACGDSKRDEPGGTARGRDDCFHEAAPALAVWGRVETPQWSMRPVCQTTRPDGRTRIARRRSVSTATFWMRRLSGIFD
nr:oxaloacetate-decarboxylating malate dehydrogenase [Nigerium massiliense]